MNASRMTFPEFTIGTPGTITVVSESADYKHSVEYYFGTLHGTAVALTSQRSLSWGPPVAFLDEIPTAPSGNGRLILSTYNGDTLVGTREYGFIASADLTTVKPSFTYVVSESTGALQIVQNHSRVTVTVTPTTAHGSPIVKTRVTIDGKTYLGSPVTSDVIAHGGSVFLGIEIEDARGAVASATGYITVLTYEPPAITVDAYRTNSVAQRDVEGINMRIHVTSTISSLNGTNYVNVTVRYKKSTETSWTTLTSSLSDYTTVMIPADVNSIYNVEVTVSDRFESTTKAANVPLAFALCSVYASGKGIAFGRDSTEEGFVVAMDARFERGIVPGINGVPFYIVQTLNLLPNLPAGFGGNGRALVFGDDTGTRFYMLISENRSLYLGTATGTGNITWNLI